MLTRNKISRKKSREIGSTRNNLWAIEKEKHRNGVGIKIVVKQLKENIVDVNGQGGSTIRTKLVLGVEILNIII